MIICRAVNTRLVSRGPLANNNSNIIIIILILVIIIIIIITRHVFQTTMDPEPNRYVFNRPLNYISHTHSYITTVLATIPTTIPATISTTVPTTIPATIPTSIQAIHVINVTITV